MNFFKTSFIEQSIQHAAWRDLIIFIMAKIVARPFPGVMSFPDVKIEASVIPEHAGSRKKRQRRAPATQHVADTPLPTKISRSRKIKPPASESITTDMEACENLGTDLKTLQPTTQKQIKKRDPKKRQTKVTVVLPALIPIEPLVLTPLRTTVPAESDACTSIG
jgi:hypothetical protein